MQLKVSLVKQNPKSDDCLRCCMLMLMNYLGDEITKEEVWKKLIVYPKKSGMHGAYFTDVGVIAIKRGLKATIYHSDFTWWDKDSLHVMSDSKKILKTLTSLKKTKKKKGHAKIIEKEINFAKRGGKFEFAFPNLDNIDKYLRRKTPVIISVNGATLNEDIKQDFLHAIVVTGKRKGKYFINDPFRDNQEVSSDKLLAAWARHGGWMLVLEK